MRILLWFTIGFAIACGIAAYLFSSVWILVSLGIVLLLTGILFIFKGCYAKISMAILLGMLLGVAWMYGYDAVYLSAARQQDGKTASVTIEIADYSYETKYGMAADGRLVSEGNTYRVRAYMNQMDALTPGDTVTGEFLLRFTATGAAEESSYHQGSGIFLLAYAQEDVRTDRAEDVPKKYFAAKLRADIQNLLDRTLPEDVSAFARALLLGDSTGLIYAQDAAFRVSGIRHVIAVSGLHISVLFSLVYILCGKHRFLTAVFGIPVLILFAAVAGFSPSILRACIMQVLMIFAMLIKKEYDPPTGLSFAVLVMLLCNPMAITSVSLQLSVGCMIGIFLFSGRIYDYLLLRWGNPKGKKIGCRLLIWVCGSVSVTLSAMALTTPLCAYYFGMVSLVGVITNLLTLWIVSVIFYGIVAVCLFGTALPGLAVGIGWVIAWPIRYVQWISRLLADFPLSAVYTCSVYILLWLALSYLLLGIFLLSRKKHPGLLAGCIAVGLAAALTASYVEPRLDNFRVTVMDVGQGQCILLQTAEGNYLVDCGGSDSEEAADVAAETLLSQGIFRLDGIILTHYDSDHAGGVPLLLSRIDADSLYLPDIRDDGENRLLLEELFSEKIQWIKEDTQIGSISKITLFTGDFRKTENESGLCVLFQQDNCDILIMGDRSSVSERELVVSTDLPELELLVVGHHGAGSSTGIELLSATCPKTAVISVGQDNSFGHPAEEVLVRLERFGCRILRTDISGTIVFRR